MALFKCFPGFLTLSHHSALVAWAIVSSDADSAVGKKLYFSHSLPSLRLLDPRVWGSTTRDPPRNSQSVELPKSWTGGSMNQGFVVGVLSRHEG